MNNRSENPFVSYQGLLTIYSKIRSAKCAVMIDIDETVLSCMKKWQEYVRSEWNIHLSLKQIKQAGSVDDCFVARNDYPEFTKWADGLRASKEFNSDFPAVRGSLKAIQELLTIPHLKLGGYLTARPEMVRKVTLDNLKNEGFPLLTMIGRPSKTPYLSSARWKINVLNHLRNTYNGILVMVDDNVEVISGIRRNNSKDRFIVAILIKTPYNKVKIKQERIATNPGDHLYIASWPKLPSICAQYTRL